MMLRRNLIDGQKYMVGASVYAIDCLSLPQKFRYPFAVTYFKRADHRVLIEDNETEAEHAFTPNELNLLTFVKVDQ